VRRAGNRVRITAQLIEIQDQTQLWAETYERDLSDVLSVQADIAQAIAREINLALNLSERTRSLVFQQGSARCNPPPMTLTYSKARYHLHEMSPRVFAGALRTLSGHSDRLRLRSGACRRGQRLRAAGHRAVDCSAA